MKYAKIINNIVDNISMVELPGYIQVDDSVYAGMAKNSDGSYSYPLATMTNEEINQMNHIAYDKYCNLDIEPFIFSTTINIDVTTVNLSNLNQKMNGWSANQLFINWKVGNVWIELDKAKLQEILTYAETLKQLKFEEIFGYGV
jgi:hypothetical protein